MAHVATTTDTRPANPVLNVTTFWRVSGLALAAVALLGVIVNAVGATGIAGFLEFDWTHNIVHAALAAVALTLGFARVNLDLSRNLAVVIGAVYLLLGVAGFLSASLFGIGTAIGLHVEFGENLVHLLIGGWGVTTGLARGA